MAQPMSTVERMFNHPESDRAALTVLSALSFTSTLDDRTTLANDKALGAKISEDHKRTAGYMAGNSRYPNRAPLAHVDIRDPANPKAMIHAENIVMHASPNQDTNGFHGMAFLVTDPKTKQTNLLIEYPGIDPAHPDRGLDVLRNGHTTPQQLIEVKPFLKDVQEQIKQRGLHINKTLVFSHSIGGQAAIRTLELAHQHPDLAKTMGGVPQVVMLEPYGARIVAESVVDATAKRIGTAKVTMHDLTSHIAEVRNVSSIDNKGVGGTFINFTSYKQLRGNEPLVPIMAAVTTANSNNFETNFNSHRALIFADMLSSNKAILVPYNAEIHTNSLVKAGFEKLVDAQNQSPDSVWPVISKVPEVIGDDFHAAVEGTKTGFHKATDFLNKINPFASHSKDHQTQPKVVSVPAAEPKQNGIHTVAHLVDPKKSPGYTVAGAHKKDLGNHSPASVAATPIAPEKGQSHSNH